MATVTVNEGILSTQTTTAFTVRNVQPEITLREGVADEGTMFTLPLTIDDPGLEDTFAVNINWADGSPIQTYNLSGNDASRELATTEPPTLSTRLEFRPTHVYADGAENDRRVVFATVTDNESGAVTTGLRQTIRNVDPVVSIAPGDYSMSEGGELVFDATVRDLGADDSTVYVSWGDGTPVQDFRFVRGQAQTLRHRFLDDAPGVGNKKFSVRLDAFDGDGGHDLEVFQDWLTNVVPVVTITPTFQGAAPEGVQVGFDVGINDPGQDSHSIRVEWGDGTADTTVQRALDAPTGVHVFHTFSDGPASRLVRATVSDDDNGTASAERTVEVGMSARPLPSIR